MKLETIKSAIREWNEVNDYVDDTYHLLNQGVLFRINPKVKRLSPSANATNVYIHAYPGVIDGELKIFLINSEMDTKERFEDTKYPINNYIYVADIDDMDEKLMSRFEKISSIPNGNIDPTEAKERISRWSLAKKSWIKNQINNTEGIFEAFIIPKSDLKPNSNIYALFAIAKQTIVEGNNAAIENDYIADLIIWDNEVNLVLSSESGLDDLVVPVPPFNTGPGISSDLTNPKDKSNFYLLDLACGNID